jgi:hypothetical protein
MNAAFRVWAGQIIMFGLTDALPDRQPHSTCVGLCVVYFCNQSLCCQSQLKHCCGTRGLPQRIQCVHQLRPVCAEHHAPVFRTCALQGLLPAVLSTYACAVCCAVLWSCAGRPPQLQAPAWCSRQCRSSRRLWQARTAADWQAHHAGAATPRRIRARCVQSVCGGGGGKLQSAGAVMQGKPYFSAYRPDVCGGGGGGGG